MATSNRRVAAYLPSEIDEAFKAFKIKNGFSDEDDPTSNDSKALIEIVKQFLNVEYQAAHPVSLPDNLVTQEQLEALRSEFELKISELLNRMTSDSLSKEDSEIAAVPSDSSGSELLSINDLAKRLEMPRSTLGQWKRLRGGKCNTPEQLAEATRKKDPDGIGWVWDEVASKFKPEQLIFSSSLSSSQGKLPVS